VRSVVVAAVGRCRGGWYCLGDERAAADRPAGGGRGVTPALEGVDAIIDIVHTRQDG
jgi:hypothetical protein